ncbi:MAG: glycosyltransferase 87 family protein, partial [Gaiellaceae bacterium]
PRPSLALAAGLAALALVAVCAASAWPEGSPLEPVNAGRPEGDERWAWLFLACAAAAFAAYVAGLLALARRGAGLAGVAVLAVAIQLAPLGAPLLLSTDAWTYWDYGRIAAFAGGNPYRDPPEEFPSDPAFQYVGARWRDSVSVYGPAFTLASEPLALAAGESADAAAWIYKSLAAAALLVCAALAAALARRKAFALAFVGWNPLLALHFAGGGHNDAWMAALVLGALALGATGRRQLAGVAWALAVLVKWIPLVFLPLRALEARAAGRRVGHLGFALAAGGVAALATVRYGTDWLGAFGPLARNANAETRFAVPHRVGQLGVPQWLATGALALAFAIAYLWLLREAWRGRARLGLAAALLLLAVPYLAPWYAVWAVPLAAADEDSRAQWLALAVCAYLLPQTVPI